jgi:hypothetical protein
MAGIANGGSLSFLRLAEAEQLAVDSGLGLFEIRKVQRSFLPLKDFGFWDVKVRMDLGHTSDSVQYMTKWYDGPNAYITCKPNKQGVCIGFCPDDPLWHNRVMLSGVLNTGNFHIDRYHTRNGVLSGAQITEELNIIRNFIHDNKVVDTKTNKLIFRSISREECEQAAAVYEEKIGIQDSDFDKTPKRVQVIWTKIERIEKLIQSYGGRWFVSDEFQKGIRLEIQDKINAFYNANKPDITTIADSLLGNIERMSDDERRRLRDLLFADKPAAQTTTQPQSQESTTTSDFTSMGIDELRKYARSIGINPDKMKKSEIQDAIRQMAAQQALSSKAMNSNGNGNIADGPVTEYPEGDEAPEEEFN